MRFQWPLRIHETQLLHCLLMRETTRPPIFSTTQTLSHCSSQPFSEVFLLLLQFVPLYFLPTLLIERCDERTGSLIYNKKKSLFCARHFLLLLQSDRARLMRSFKFMYKCEISTILTIDSLTGNSLFYCYSPAPWFTHSCGASSALEIEDVYCVCKERIWNRFHCGNRVPSSRGTSDFDCSHQASACFNVAQR